jgi:signal transduction histidine kinase
MDVSWGLLLDARSPGSPWAVLSDRLGGSARVLGVFASLYAAAVVFGLAPAEPIGGAIIIWPATGLLLLALWFSERRLWPAILLIQIALEVFLGPVLSRAPPAQFLSASLAHALAGVIGAVIVRRLLDGIEGLRVVALLRFAYAAAAGTAAGTVVYGMAALLPGADADLPRLALLWWLASLLGVLTTVPALLAWLLSRRFAHLFPPLSRARRIELAVVMLVQVVVALRVFGGWDIGPENLRFPVMIMPGLFYAAFRLPPRWSTTLMGGTGLLVLWLVAHGGNPLAMQEPVARVLWMQFGVLIFLLASVVLSVYIAQSHIALEELAASQSRYRRFIEMSSEAVWRVELAQPMPMDLAPAQQLEWLRRHAHIAESSASYARITGGAAAQGEGWAAGLPWVQVLEANLEQARQHGFRVEELRFSAINGGQVRTYLATFDGVVQGGRLERIWGVARDVTESFELNARLQREQGLLRSYAQRIAGAEESARRSTAQDLHSGIGQELAAMGMMVTALGNGLAPEQRARLDELRGRLHRVQERTREMISDLSPPGLYELGLLPALQWLVVYLRNQDQPLRVELDGEVDETAMPVALRVLIFKLIRELLRNVVKHAGVDTAAVRVRGDQSRLLVEVRDEGRGFDWDPAHLTSPLRGFGLWSIADRLAPLGGQLSVTSAPGRGARFTLEIPLRR